MWCYLRFREFLDISKCFCSDICMVRIHALEMNYFFLEKLHSVVVLLIIDIANDLVKL